VKERGNSLLHGKNKPVVTEGDRGRVDFPDLVRVFTNQLSRDFQTKRLTLAEITQDHGEKTVPGEVAGIY